MELVNVTNSAIEQPVDIQEKEQTTSDQFIQANTKAISFNRLSQDCIIPTFADNQTIISHQDFIERTCNMVGFAFQGEQVLSPAIRVSHPMKGRIPEAKHKSVKDLQEHEKTLYYERMAFMMDIPSIHDTIGDNDLCLSVGGIRALNRENLYSRRSPEKFQVFIGFKNMVCLNLCVSTDGFCSEIKASNQQELAKGILNNI